MGWDTIIGQTRAVSTLQSAVSSGRVAHAYLFHGPDGVGKRAAALALAQALLCTGSSTPCGVCGPCEKVRRLIHPDLHVMIPQPNDARSEDIQERLQLLVSEPYATIDYVRRAKLDEVASSSGKQIQYSVGRIRHDPDAPPSTGIPLRRTMSFRPVEGRYKIAVLTDADLLRREASNAFLKILEEPTAQTVFILTSSRPDRMLPTILSRCQHVRFDRLEISQIVSGLTDRSIMDAESAEAVARMADGSFGRALDLASSEDLMAARGEVLTFLRQAFRVWTAADKMAEQVERLSRHGREQVKFVLELMLGWIRDLALVRVLADKAPIVNIDQKEEIRKFALSLPDANPEIMAQLVEECIVRLERNANPRLLLTVLAQGLGDAMHGKPIEHLTDSLTDGV
ncbi:MAG: DNA polymerase-3 subunit delta' [Rhodothermales bacterium]|jgi:DNA polymerase-3 subunit delta'